jgi:hypothetical protein
MQVFDVKQGIFGPGGHGGGIFQTTISGLGAPVYNTKEGIFGPGGHGGGIFQTTISGLGTTDVGARGVYSEKTYNTQLMANAVLPRIGFVKIEEDGILGDETCRAIHRIVASGRYKDWTVPSNCGTTNSLFSSEADLYAEPGLSTMAKVLIAGAMVAVGVGSYVVWKRTR